MYTNCGRCHTCNTHLKVCLDGEEWCPKCKCYQRYKSHGWATRDGLTCAYRPWEWYAETYPRLIRNMQFVAILSKGEAACALRDHKLGMLFSGEAVTHWCGGKPIRTLIERAWQMRHQIAQVRVDAQ